MADFDYGFVQSELETLLNHQDTKFIMVSVSALKEGNPGISEMYYFAQSYNVQGLLNQGNVPFLAPIVACPYPPKWKDDPSRTIPTHQQLDTAPKFKFDAATLKTKLQNNNFPAANEREAIVRMSADSTSGLLGIEMKFRILNADGKETDMLEGIRF